MMIAVATLMMDGGGWLLAGIGLGAGAMWWRQRAARARAITQANGVLDQARREAEGVVRDARLSAADDARKWREEAEQSLAQAQQARREREQRLTEREGLVNTQLAGLVAAETGLREQKAALTRQAAVLAAQQQEADHLTRERLQQLEAVAHLTPVEARAQLLREIELEAARDAGNLARHIIEEARTQAEAKARQILSVAIQRYAGEHTFETTTATITLQGDEMKGRIIGRDGRNIRSFEQATGVTVLIDDTPNAVVLSGFDPVRREVAREAMTRLILDGRIHPTRIEEVVAKVAQEMDETIFRLGEEAVQKTGLPPLHPELVKLLGKLHFRLSYSQNVLNHSVEVAHLMGLMAAELGLDITVAKRAGLLHDIGKAVSHEVEGPHALVGAEFAKRHGLCDEVVNGIASHHNDVPPVGPWGILVSAADAISASRPGARSESMATYLRRVQDLEKIALAFPGVEKCFAAQAGRELRVLVVPEQVSDDQAQVLARNIALKIEGELQYPGQIRITVIREKRCIVVAK